MRILLILLFIPCLSFADPLAEIAKIEPTIQAIRVASEAKDIKLNVNGQHYVAQSWSEAFNAWKDMVLNNDIKKGSK